jgi:hypothetical protein
MEWDGKESDGGWTPERVVEGGRRREDEGSGARLVGKKRGDGWRI